MNLNGYDGNILRGVGLHALQLESFCVIGSVVVVVAVHVIVTDGFAPDRDVDGVGSSQFFDARSSSFGLLLFLLNGQS